MPEPVNAINCSLRRTHLIAHPTSPSPAAHLPDAVLGSHATVHSCSRLATIPPQHHAAPGHTCAAAFDALPATRFFSAAAFITQGWRGTVQTRFPHPHPTAQNFHSHSLHHISFPLADASFMLEILRSPFSANSSGTLGHFPLHHQIFTCVFHLIFSFSLCFLYLYHSDEVNSFQRASSELIGHNRFSITYKETWGDTAQ